MPAIRHLTDECALAIAPSPQQSHALCLPEFSKVSPVSITPIAKSCKPYIYSAHEPSRAPRRRDLRVTRCFVRTRNARVESRAPKQIAVDAERRTLAADAIGDFLMWADARIAEVAKTFEFPEFEHIKV